MSKRAKEAAWKAYPGKITVINEDGTESIWEDSVLDGERRRLFVKGYEQAEKDLALTKDDVWCIFNLVRDLQTKYPATEGCLQEVADIFNEQRDK